MKTVIIVIAAIIALLGFFIINNPELFDKKTAGASTASILNTPKSSHIAETDNRWFIIENVTGKCRPDEGPAKMIKNLQALGQPYNIIDDDIVDGKPLQVRLLLHDGFESGQIVYYRGENRCKEQATINKQANDLELNKYK